MGQYYGVARDVVPYSALPYHVFLCLEYAVSKLLPFPFTVTLNSDRARARNLCACQLEQHFQSVGCLLVCSMKS